MNEACDGGSGQLKIVDTASKNALVALLQVKGTGSALHVFTSMHECCTSKKQRVPFLFVA